MSDEAKFKIDDQWYYRLKEHVDLHTRTAERNRLMCGVLQQQNNDLRDELLSCRSKLALAAENSAGDDEMINDLSKRVNDLKEGVEEANRRWIEARDAQLDVTRALFKAGVHSFGTNAQGVEKLAEKLATSPSPSPK